MIKDENPYEGIESLADGRFAAFANKWPPFFHHVLIGTFDSLDEAINARNAALATKAKKRKAAIETKMMAGYETR